MSLIELSRWVEREICEQLDKMFFARISPLTGEEPASELKHELRSVLRDLLKYAAIAAPNMLNERLRGSVSGGSTKGNYRQQVEDDYAVKLAAIADLKLELLKAEKAKDKVKHELGLANARYDELKSIIDSRKQAQDDKRAEINDSLSDASNKWAGAIRILSETIDKIAESGPAPPVAAHPEEM